MNGASLPSRAAAGSLMLLAPSTRAVPASFREVDADPDYHAELLARLQRLRGSVYLEDGAIDASQLTPDGRHVQEADQHSWHVITVQPDGDVTGCARYRPHSRHVEPEDLGIWRSALARDPEWQSALRNAVADDIQFARTSNLAYAEVGGWAVARPWRGTMHAFETAISTYALAAGLGGCIGITTATLRHCSSRILRKLGGRSLEFAGAALPSYFDPGYGCEMEILRFNSNAPSQRYGAHVRRMSRRFMDVPVVVSRAAVSVMAAPGRLAARTILADRHIPCFLPQEVCVPSGAQT